VFRQFFRQRGGSFFFAVHEYQILKRFFGSQRVLHQQILPGVGAEAADGDNFRLAVVFIAKNAHLALLVCQPSAQSVRSLPGDNQNSIASIFDVIGKVMLDAPAFRHARSRDNHHGAVVFIQRLGFVHAARKNQVVKVQTLHAVLSNVLPGFVIKTLGVLAVQVRGVDRQRAVDDHRDVRDIAVVYGFTEHVTQVLRASNCESRHDYLAAALYRAVDRVYKLIVGVFQPLVLLITVGAFHQQCVGVFGHHRVLQNWRVQPAYITGKPKALVLAVFLVVQRDRR